MLKHVRKGEVKVGNVLYMFKPNGKEHKVKIRKVEDTRLHYSTITKAGKVSKTVKVGTLSEFRRWEY